jgi:HlyD family secretion protein
MLENTRMSVQERPVQPVERPLPGADEPDAARLPAHHWKPLLTGFLILCVIVIGTINYSRRQSGIALPEGLIQVNGRMEGDSVTVASKFAGRIAHLLAREGSVVTRGQVLVNIDDVQTHDQLDQASANLRLAIAQEQGAITNVSLTSATTSAQIVQAEGVVREAQSGIAGARADLERARAAVANTEAGVRGAAANVAAAKAGLEAVRANKLSAEAGLASAQAQIAEAQANALAAHSTADAAQANYERASRDAHRFSQLFTERAVSAQSADQANLAAQAGSAQVESARRQAAAAEAVVTVRQSEADAARRQIAASEAAVAQAVAQLEAAREQVQAANAGKRQAFAQARAAGEMVRQAVAKYQQAWGELEKARTAPQQIDISRTNRAQATAVRARAGAAVNELNTVLHDLSLVSPISGTVTTRLRDEGEVISAGTPVLDLVDLDKLYLKAYVPEDQIGKLRLGLPARITVDAFPKTYFDATVSYIASTAEFTPKEVQTPEERVKLVYAIKLAVTNNVERRLTPGMVADAVIRWKETTPWQAPRW